MRVQPHDGTSDLIKGTPGSSLLLPPCEDAEKCPQSETQNLAMLAPQSQTSDLPKCEKWVSVVYKPECVLRCFSSWNRQRSSPCQLSAQPRALHWSVDRQGGRARCGPALSSVLLPVWRRCQINNRSGKGAKNAVIDYLVLIALFQYLQGFDKCPACLENNKKESFFHQRPNVAAFNHHNI